MHLLTKQIMKDQKYDCLLLPGGMLPAYPVGSSKDYVFLQSYLQLPNSLKMCTGTVPIKKVEEAEENELAKKNLGLFAFA